MPPKPTPPAHEPHAVRLPGNPFTTSEAPWAEQAFMGLQAQLEEAIQGVQRKLGEAWEEGVRAGHAQGFQAGAEETEGTLRPFYEAALIEQEASAARALAEEVERLRGAHDAELAALRETTRRELERLSAKHSAALEGLRASVRRELAAELQHRFNTELVQAEARVRRETEAELQQRFEAERQQLEARVRQETEETMRSVGPSPEEPGEREREARAEGYTQGLNESARRYEEAMTRVALERREAVEAAYKKGFDAAGAQTEKELLAAQQEGYRQGLLEAGREFASAAAGTLPAPLLDEARRQAYQNGYEDGRSVGLARGRRQAEAEESSRLQEATRQAYREGLQDGKRTVADADRSWAFGVLHLPSDAMPSEIKQHYKRLSMALHPDQNPQLADVFIKNLNRARQLLDG